MPLLAANLVGSLLAAFAALYLGQQWLEDEHTPVSMAETHRAVLLVMACLLVWHGVDPSLFNQVLIVWGIGFLWVLRIAARIVTAGTPDRQLARTTGPTD